MIETPGVTSGLAGSEGGLDEMLGGLRHLGAYKVIGADSMLTFPEPNMARLIFRSTVEVETVTEVRFMQRKYKWTGSGIQNPPRITATLGGEKLHAVRHGPVYSIGEFRAFLIDLGRDIDAGEHLHLETAMQFIDENGTFEPYHLYATSPYLRRLSLAVRFIEPPAECTHQFRAEDGAEWSEPTALRHVLEEGMTTFHFTSDSPEVGSHRLHWRPIA